MKQALIKALTTLISAITLIVYRAVVYGFVLLLIEGLLRMFNLHLSFITHI